MVTVSLALKVEYTLSGKVIKNEMANISIIVSKC